MIDFTKEINIENYVLKFGFFGIENNGEIKDLNKFILNIYCYDNKSYKKIFEKKLNFNEFKDFFNDFEIFGRINLDNKNSINLLENLISDLENLDLEIFKQFFIKVKGKEKINFILESLDEVEVENLYASVKQKKFKKEIENLKQLLLLEEKNKLDLDFISEINKNEHLNKYYAKKGEEVFQKWIEENLWVFDLEYAENIGRVDINEFNIKETLLNTVNKKKKNFPDLVMKNIYSYLNLIEIKRPRAKIFNFDKSHNSYHPTSELSRAEGQCMNYLDILDNKVDKNKFEECFSCKLKRPKIKLIIGKLTEETEKENLRTLNFHRNQIEIITYTDIINMGEKIIQAYDNPPL